ncbi:cobaltochelatase subunit CobN [Desulfofundulus salinus]|uniref:Cobaltochelatase subunit CobN n=1 Tax=Desulfofundulus salinus TaxID=2419843 RepID=A0A494WT66_9FIRM|nr:cobaltochelatase subunit CobN [Desulfofundulus salinum]RKO66556.1 cobaltochelatase subunit CobN [Desulfofundulus salinum]
MPTGKAKWKKHPTLLFLSLIVLIIVFLISASGAAANENARTRVVMLLGSEGFLVPLVDAYGQLQNYPVELKLFSSNDLKSEEKIQQLKQSLQDADVFLMEMIGASTIQTVGPLLQDLPEKCEVLSTRSGSFPEYPRIDESQNTFLAQYFVNGGVENMRRLVLYLASRYGQVTTGEQLDPVKMPVRFIYHPDAEGLTFNVDGLYQTVCNAVYAAGDSAAQGLAVNEVHRAVYDSVYASVYQPDNSTNWTLARLAVNQAVYDRCGGASTLDTSGLYRTVAEAVYLAEQGETGLQALYDTVRQSVYQAVYHSDGQSAGLAVDTVYNALYDRVAAAYLGDAQATVYRAVYDALWGPELSGFDLTQVYQSVHDAVYLPTGGGGGTGLPPGTFGTSGGYLAWYKASGHLKEGAPWVGIISYDSFFKNSDIDMYLAVQRELEARGVNALLVFSDSSSRKTAFQDFFMPGGKRQVDFLIAGIGFNFIYGQPEAGIELFKQLNVPVMAPVYSSDLEDWQSNPAGISSEVAWQIAYPELDGRIEPVFMGGSTLVRVDESTGARIVKKVPLPDRIDRLVGRALAWVNLRQKSNADKKIALVYYNHHAGKDDIGAAYLNSIASAAVILQALRDNGYRVEGDLSPQAIEELIRRQGRNVGSWAPGELAELVQAGALVLPVEKYLEWYATLPGELRAQVEKEWGPPPGNIMVYEGNLVIPGATLGNIFLGPQPVRGWGDDPDKIAHSPALPPPHQYIAFYLWLQKEFCADAVIHLGTHGTLEWLPGRSVGLGENDWPDVLIGNMPDIYPYIVNNPGEGTQAKRRGYAVTIDHLIPPMIQPGLYGELAELQQLVVEYQNALSGGNTARAASLQEQIMEKVKANSLDQDLGIDLQATEFSRVAFLLHEYLEELATELMPYGLHTFGLPPQGEMLDLMVDSIVAYDKEAREGSREEIRERLLLTINEITNLLRALSGEFIEPGLGRDPVRVPDALPTGRNLVSFDPRMVPDAAAWKTGKEAADQLVARFYAENGRYPETVGVVLWAIETMRTQGETVALILRLIGTEPVWDKSGRVSTVKVIPLEELGRPRINVLVTISGLFRDTFSHVVGVLDEAFRKVALLNEDPESNLVRKVYLDLRDKLQEQGLSEQEADALALARIFGDAPGTYGTGVSELAQATSAWEDKGDLVDTYMNRMSYIYGKTAYGVPARDVFREILKSVDVVTQVRDSLWGVLDNDDVAQYLGGLKLAAEAASGEKVQSYIVNTRTGSARVQTLSEFVGTELRSRLLNPKWIEGMLKEGYAGAREIGDHVANMFLVDATLEGIGDWAWRQVAETFIFDDKIRSQLDPFVVQSIIGWSLEAARRQMWQADQETLTRLADIYMQTAAQYGVVCCHHTCANIKFNEWVASYSTLDSSMLNRFKEVFSKATKRDLNLKTEVSAPSSRHQSPSRAAEQVRAQEPPVQQPVTQPVPVQQSVEQKPETTQVLPAASTGAGEGEKATEGSPSRQEQQVSQNTGAAGAGPQQVTSREMPQQKADEQAQRPGGRAYELEVEKKAQATATARKAVSFVAILGALGLLALFIKGYFAGRT